MTTTSASPASQSCKGARMAGDHLGPAGDHHRVDVTADQHLAVAVGGRHRVVGTAITH
jgi:hypothetical protein